MTASRLPQPVDAGLAPSTTRAARAAELVAQASAHLARSDEPAFIAYLRADWSADELADLLNDLNEQSTDATGTTSAVRPMIDQVKTTAIALGLIGTIDQSPTLARTLHHDDYFVVNIAERALWNIWFRASTPECCALLADAIDAMHAEDFDQAENTLDRILLAAPDFAEACNQRAVLHYLTDRFASSLMACRRTLALNPYHFGAAAGMGHNLVQLGQFADAEAAYRAALRIHPRMEGVRQQLRRARESAPAPTPREPWRRPH